MSIGDASCAVPYAVPLGPEDISRQVHDAAARLTAATLWHVQWDDAVFPRDGQLALFDALGCANKRLIGFPR